MPLQRSPTKPRETPMPPRKTRFGDSDPFRHWRRREKHPEGTRKRLTEDCDELVSLIVRRRDGRCVVCGTFRNLQCGHFWTRKVHATRWCLVNCNTQCGFCNQRHNKDRDPYTSAMVRIYGLEVVGRLRDARYSKRRYEDYELMQMRDELRGLLRLSPIELRALTLELAKAA